MDIWVLTYKNRADSFDYVFHFNKPPSREDFLKVCDGIPWTSAWDFVSAVKSESVDWPMVSDTQKSADQKIINNEGVHVATVAVRRYKLYDVDGYDRFRVSEDWTVGDKVQRHLGESGNILLMNRTNRFRENLCKYPKLSAYEVAKQFIKSLMKS